MSDELEAIKADQCQWAERRGIALDRNGYAIEHFHNLYNRCLRPEAKAEYQQGDGAEPDRKMWALHSSSALVYNFFDHWRTNDVAALTQSLGLPVGLYKLELEHKLCKPPGIPGKKPNVDVFFSGDHLLPVAIESKFTEPYQRRTKMDLKEAYAKVPGLWEKYPKCGELAVALTKNQGGFQYLDAPQLLKHIVGLKTCFDDGAFELIYLWYKVPGALAGTLESEIARFQERVGNEVRFRELTYQAEFAQLTRWRDRHGDWFEYM